MEGDFKRAQTLNDGNQFEKLQLQKRIDILEESLEREKGFNANLKSTQDNKVASILDGIDGERLSLSSELDQKMRMTNVLQDIGNYVIAEINEEEKDSNFGDYGDESSGDDSQDEKKNQVLPAFPANEKGQF